MQGTSGGEIIAFDRGSVPAVREDYTKAIQLWCQTRDTAAALTREEIGKLDKFNRIDAQRKAIILSLAHYYRTHQRSDVAPGVAVIMTLLSDNDKGVATISQAKLAALFGRSRSAIVDAQGRLREDGIIVTGRGCKAGTYPVIPRAVTTSYNHLTWLIDAVCAQDAKANCRDPQDNSELSGQTLQFDESSGETLQLPAPNCSVEPDGIVRPDRHYFTKGNSKEDTTLEGARDARSLTKAVAFGIVAAAVSLPAAAAPIDPPAIAQPANPEISYDELKAKLMEAGGEAIGISAGLEVLSVPRRWLMAGCDLTEDILPAIRARAAKMPPRSINSWNYFEQAVADARAARGRPMPEGRAAPGGRLAPWEEDEIRRSRAADEALERLRIKYEENGVS